MSEASIIFQSDSVTPEALAHLGEGFAGVQDVAGA